jgi:magnesium transporter
MTTPNYGSEELRLAVRSTGQRLPWLAVTVAGGIIMTELVSHFGYVIEKEAAIAGFIPVMMGMSGNVAIQASTISIFGITSGKTNGSVRKLILEEIRVGALLGIGFALLMGTYAYFRFASLQLSLAISISATLELAAAATYGMLVPLFFHRFGVNSSVATGPVVTTGGDVLALVIYFTSCTVVLGW